MSNSKRKRLQAEGKLKDNGMRGAATNNEAMPHTSVVGHHCWRRILLVHSAANRYERRRALRNFKKFVANYRPPKKAKAASA